MAAGEDFVTVHLDSRNGIFQVRELGNNESIGRSEVRYQTSQYDNQGELSKVAYHLQALKTKETVLSPTRLLPIHYNRFSHLRYVS